MKRTFGNREKVPFVRRLSIVRGVEQELHCGRRHVGQNVGAAIRRIGMDEHNGFASIQLLENGRVGWVAEPLIAVAGEQRDSAGVKRVQRIFDFFQTALRVRQRQSCEQAKLCAMVHDELGAVVIAFARKAPSRLARVKRNTRNRERQHRARNAALVHVF